MWSFTDHAGDRVRLGAVTDDEYGCVAELDLSVAEGAPVHLDREALADLVRAAAPLAGLSVVDGEPEPEVDGEPGLDPEDRAAAVAAVWGGRCKGESTGWLWSSTVDVAHYIATGEVPA